MYLTTIITHGNMQLALLVQPKVYNSRVLFEIWRRKLKGMPVHDILTTCTLDIGESVPCRNLRSSFAK